MDLRHLARDATAEWLSAQPWDLFVTLTDPGMSHPEHMTKRHRYLIHKVNDSLYGKRWTKRTAGIEYVTGLERQARGSVHIHALWRFPDHDPADALTFSRRRWQAFADNLGGIARLEPVRSQTDVVAYVTKYVLKEGDLDLSPGFNPDSPRCRAHHALALRGGGCAREAGAPPRMARTKEQP